MIEILLRNLYSPVDHNLIYDWELGIFISLRRKRKPSHITFIKCKKVRWAQLHSNHTIRKVKFLSKNSILTKPQDFHEFFTQIFFDNFSREIKVVNSWKVQNHNIFTSFSPSKNRQFSLEIKAEFLDKKWRFRTVCYLTNEKGWNCRIACFLKFLRSCLIKVLSDLRASRVRPKWFFWLVVHNNKSWVMAT